MTDYSRLPPHMQDTARRYIERGIPGGSFFMAVVENNLVSAFQKADEANTAAMQAWASWLYNEVPRNAWGSPEIVSAWVRRFQS